MKKLIHKSLLKRNRIVSLVLQAMLVIFALLLAVQNYDHGTWLLGWDNLAPEFDFWINIKRSLSAVWQEYQGVGLLGGMAHAADLPRQIILFSTSLAVPQELVRYLWTFAMLAIGPLGAYHLASYFLKGKGKQIGSFSAGFIYLFNLATVQYFFTPFETFTTFYGALPWLLLLMLRAIEKPSKARLAALFGVLIVFSSAFYVQTMFLVFALVAAVFVFEFFVAKKKRAFKNIILVSATVFSATAFWLLPVAFFTATNVSVIENAKINQIASIETRLQNQGYGNFLDIAQLKGFWFSFTDAAAGEVDYLMPMWREHMQSPAVQMFLVSTFLVGLAGLLLLAKTKLKWRFSPLAILILAILFLSGASFLADIPVLGESLRSPFTKWSVVLALFVSLGVGSFVSFVYGIKNSAFKILGSGLVFVLMLASLFAFKPAFEGRLISPATRVSMPAEYFGLFDYFKSQPKQSRIAFMPMQSMWGWNFYGWGYRGSGFLWYGIEQPILDRAFDVWSDQNENFYLEASHALYQNDSDTFGKVLDKYDVSYVLLDENVVLPSDQLDTLNYLKTKENLQELGGELDWQQGKVSVYKLPGHSDSFVYSTNASEKGVLPQDALVDPIYLQNGDYISEGQRHPFSTLASEAATKKADGSVYVSTELLSTEQVLSIPGISPESSQLLSASLEYLDGEVKIDFLLPYLSEIGPVAQVPSINVPVVYEGEAVAVQIGDQSVRVSNGEVSLVSNIKVTFDTPLPVSVYAESENHIDISDEINAQAVDKCWEREGLVGHVSATLDSGEINIVTKDAVGCVSIKLTDFSEDSLLSVSLPHKSDTGTRPHFCVLEEGTDECLHKDVYYNSSSSLEWAEVTRTASLEADKSYWINIAARPSEQEGVETAITYKTPEISVAPLLEEFQINPIAWEDYLKPKTIELPEELEKLEIVLASSPLKTDFAGSGVDTPTNCDIFDRGEVGRIIKGSEIEYSAAGYAASCDYARLTGVSTAHEYLLSITSANISGRGLKATLHNLATNRNDSQLILSDSQQIELLSWPQAENSYVLNLETRSLGGEKAEDILGKVAAYPLPLSWLSGISIGQGEAREYGPAQVREVQKFGTWLYMADIETDAESVLVLSQGYNSGWIAIGAGEHKAFNSWANAWKVPAGESTVYMVYLPQLLQWVGLALIPIFGLYLLKR